MHSLDHCSTSYCPPVNRSVLDRGHSLCMQIGITSKVLLVLGVACTLTNGICDDPQNIG